MAGNRATHQQPETERIPARLSENELVAVLERRSREIPALEALKELNQRRSGKAKRLMASILADSGYPSDLRASAAVALGRSKGAPGRRALAQALRSRQPAVVRRAAEALGRMGDEEALEALAPLRSRRPEVRRSVAFARTLISYRLGLGRYRLKPPPEASLLEVRPDEAMPLRLRSVAAGRLDEMSDNLTHVLPAIPVSREGAQSFTCGKNRFLVVFHQQVHRWRTLSPLNRRDAVVAAVLKRSQVGGGYFVYEYVMLDHAARRGSRIYGVRPSGVVTHYGAADLASSGLSAHLQTVNTPYSPPLDLQLAYDHESRKLRFVSAWLHPQPTEYQERAAAPKRLVLPIG